MAEPTTQLPETPETDAAPPPGYSEKADDELLEKLGYKQVLYRGFDWVMSFTFCLTAVNCISSIVTVYALGLETGGPVVMFWGWIVVTFFTILTGLAMAEICSTYPSAGSVYHWTGQLCTRKWAPLMSYIDGWFNFVGNAAGDASFAYAFASMISAASAAARAPYGVFDMTVQDASYGGSESFYYYYGSAAGSNATGPTDEYFGFTDGAKVGLAIATMFVWALINALRIDQQGWVNNFAAGWQITTTIIVCAVILAMAPELNTASFVFTYWNNSTGWNSTGYVVLLGLLYSTFTFSGYEAGGHLAEETRQASRAAPWGIIGCCIGTALIGFVLTISFNYATPNIGDIILNPYTGGQPVVAMFFYAAGAAGGLAMTVLMIINLFFAGISSLTVTSRIAYALARDGAFPGSPTIRIIWPATKSPIGTVVLVFVVDSIVLLLALSPTSAFFNVTALTVIGYQISYAIPILMRVTSGRKTFRPTHIRLGKFAEPIAWTAGIWQVFTACILFWPSVGPVTPANMNYAVVVVAGCFVIALIWWLVSARYHFRGPPRADDAFEASPSGAPLAPMGKDASEPERAASSDQALDSKVAPVSA